MVMMETVRPMLFALLAAFVVTNLVHAQVDEPGFISIDCGTSTDYSNDTSDLNYVPDECFISIDCGALANYTDETSGLNYVSDATFSETGVTGSISSSQKIANLSQQFNTLRSFPNGTRNCYTIKSSRALSSKYLIRARFLYGNYDGLNDLPTFDLHLGTNTWATVEFVDAAISVSKEIIAKFTSVYTSVCLVNTGLGTPFISALELRPMKGTTYSPKRRSLVLFKRFNFGSTRTGEIRYNDDVFDRLWVPFDWPEMAYINTSLTVDADSKDYYPLPSIVMQTAITPKNASEPISFYWDPKDPITEYSVYMHFAEFEKLQHNQTREFTVTFNGLLWYGPLRPDYLSTTTLYNYSPKSSDRFTFQLTRTENSTLPPLINALEIYEVNQLLQAPTSQEEVNAMKNIKATYGMKKNWQGDPCAPQTYMWDGLNCSFSGYDTPNITYLNMSSSGLTGEIPSFIGDLKSLQTLDLSNNNLNGSVPDFLTQLSSLRVLNLARNKLTGPIPPYLMARSNNGLLSLSVEENVDLCASTSCTSTKEMKKKKKSNSVVIPTVASIAGVTIFFFLVALAIWFSRKRKNQVNALQLSKKTNLQGRLLDSINQQFSYSEVLIITNNLEKVIGKGGFGPVYYGYLEDTEVAVKMLSSSSVQGYKEFRAEIEFLSRVHHRNLTSLVGFCDEGDNIGLIYEYMANGNLKEHLSDRHPNVLSWGKRLRIALDAAIGLEYLHYGCKPPIIHRDVKTANILLNEKFQAKLADFGLSKAFPVDNTHVSTAVAGTMGYLDPEYHVTYQLKEKSDVFSFGVVLLEIITSRSVITRDMETAHISKWVSFMLETEGDIRSIVDARLGGDFEVHSVQKAIEIAMACASPTSVQRPTMNQVVIELQQCLVAELARINESRGANLEDSTGGACSNFYSELSLDGRLLLELTGRPLNPPGNWIKLVTCCPTIARIQEKTHLSKWDSHMIKTKGDVRDMVDLKVRQFLSGKQSAAMECESSPLP